MRELSNKPHNVKCRENAKRLYYTEDGKTKSALKYYKRFYGKTEFYQELMNDKNLTLKEKLKEIKLYHFKKKIETL